MSSELETQEGDVLERLRRQYERNGYTFMSQPRGTSIPTFLKGYTPDAIAIGAQEKVIIEVKSTERSASQSSVIRFLASEVPKHQGWRFDLVIAEKDMKFEDGKAEPDKEQLAEELSSVRDAAQSGELNVALVLGWALLEAVTRRLVLNQKAGESKRYLPRTIIETLVSEGFADDETGERLSQLASTRNRLVHGFTKLELVKEEIDFLLQFIAALMQELR